MPCSYKFPTGLDIPISATLKQELMMPTAPRRLLRRFHESLRNYTNCVCVCARARAFFVNANSHYFKLKTSLSYFVGTFITGV